jgi:hypothetical protein
MLVLSPSQLPRLPRGYLDRLFYLEALEAARGRSELLTPRGTDPKLPEPIRRSVSSFAREFRTRHGLIDRPLAERLVRFVRSGITRRRKPGSKPNQETLQAAALIRQDLRWEEVYPRVITEFPNLPKDGQDVHAANLRRNVRRHLRKIGVRSPVRPGRPARNQRGTRGVSLK